MEKQLLVRGLIALAIVDPTVVALQAGQTLVDYPPTIPLEDMSEGFIRVLLDEGVAAAEAYHALPKYPRELSLWHFRNRFTFPQRVALEASRSTDPEVGALMEDLGSAKDKMVDLALPATRGGVYLLVSKGLISTTRAEHVLHHGDGELPDPEPPPAP
jgi:hypothetical protein